MAIAATTAILIPRRRRRSSPLTIRRRARSSPPLRLIGNRTRSFRIGWRRRPENSWSRSRRSRSRSRSWEPTPLRGWCFQRQSHQCKRHHRKRGPRHRSRPRARTPLVSGANEPKSIRTLTIRPDGSDASGRPCGRPPTAELTTARCRQCAPDYATCSQSNGTGAQWHWTNFARAAGIAERIGRSAGAALTHGPGPSTADPGCA